jgi:hypothetical protein
LSAVTNTEVVRIDFPATPGAASPAIIPAAILQAASPPNSCPSATVAVNAPPSRIAAYSSGSPFIDTTIASLFAAATAVAAPTPSEPKPPTTAFTAGLACKAVSTDF